MTRAEHYSYIDYLRIIASFAVVIIHVTAALERESGSFVWAINQCSMFAVPIFVMIGGAMALNDNNNALTFYRKRMPRLLYAVLFWNMIYFSANALSDFLNTGGENIQTKTIHALINLSTAFHLWYLPMYIGLVWITPYITSMIYGRELSRKETSIALLTLFFISFTSWLPKNWGINYLFPPVNALSYSLLFVVGFILHKFANKIRFNIPTWILIVILWMCVGLFAQIDFPDMQYFNYLSFPMFLGASAIFILVRKLNMPSFKIVSVVADCSFGIYLIHMLFIQLLFRLSPPLSTFGYSFIVSLLVWGLSFVAVFCIKRTRLGKCIC